MASVRENQLNRDGPESKDKKSKKHKFVQEGIMRAEIHDLLSRMLYEDGYAGFQSKMTPGKTRIDIRATRTREVVGKGKRAAEIASLIEKRYNKTPDSVEINVDRVQSRGLCAMAQVESLRYKLEDSIPVRRAAYGVLRHIMDSGATGCEVIVSGLLRAQRAKSMKFKDGYMISTGDPVNYYIDRAVRSVQMKRGVLGVQIKIMLPHDPSGLIGPKTPMPDAIVVRPPKQIIEPKEVVIEGVVEDNSIEKQQVQPVVVAE
eukprot:GHVP01048234.1.p1 GENE.GHVP01048234.1~~GHVP01048234.1.p1  ORF type:complete len:260 (+),score=34.47 GHVP01048234.1:26-805(+)